MFGEVEVTRLAYRARGAENLYPADAQLNLPAERHSHGIRRLAALEAPRSSFQDAPAAILRQTGQQVGTRQLRELAAAAAAAVDFTAFYEQPGRPAGEREDVLVLSCDGKGVVMRPESLRAVTQKHAQDTQQKLSTRLSKGEKRGRKRIAEVCAVYEVTPTERSAADILPADDQERQAARPAPKAKHKWLSAQPASPKTPQRSCLTCSARLSAATPTTRARGSRSSTATTTRSTGSRRRPRPAS